MLQAPLILKMVRYQRGAPYLMGCMVSVCAFVCFFLSNGLSLSEVIGRQDIGGWVVRREKGKENGGRFREAGQT